jgi:hypothetical protein
MSCPTTNEVREILPTECIGNSLATINFNFNQLRIGACDNFSFITTLQQSIQQLNTTLYNLSAITIPGTAKAWVKFNGAAGTDNIIDTDLNDRFVYSSYNIESVFKKGVGDYRINFKQKFPTQNYAVIGTNQQTTTTLGGPLSGQFVWFQPYTYTTLYTEIKTFSKDNIGADPLHISLVIF